MSLLNNYHLRLEELDHNKKKSENNKYGSQTQVNRLDYQKKMDFKEYEQFQIDHKQKIHQNSLIDLNQNAESTRNRTTVEKQDSQFNQIDRNNIQSVFVKSHTQFKFQDNKYLSNPLNKSSTQFLVKRNLVIKENEIQKLPTQVIQDNGFEKQKVDLFDSQIKLSYLKNKHKENTQRLNRNNHLNYLQIKESDRNKDSIHKIQKQIKEITYKLSIINRQIEETKEKNNKVINYNAEKMNEIQQYESQLKDQQNKTKSNEQMIVSLNKEYLMNRRSNKFMFQYNQKVDRILETCEQKLMSLEYQKQNYNQRLKQ